MIGGKRATERLADVGGAKGGRKIENGGQEERLWIRAAVRAVGERGGDRSGMVRPRSQWRGESLLHGEGRPRQATFRLIRTITMPTSTGSRG